ncbi:helix-turn-helix transcriptional regulator [Arabiibacter massiliensis]|uniref:helix-turn-helix transcriptional regulator n=1 Tax=Arabiibacter massiliensis TaxID=1870985 RepID=UPI0009BC2CAF|nr:LuxR family transcriptional regulator [Arabiibacter massiliensis]
MTSRSSISPYAKALPALCFLALCFSSLYGWMVNASLFAETALFAPFTRDASMLLSAALFVILAIAANRRPDFLDNRLMSLVSLGCLASSAIVIPLAFQVQSPAFTFAGLALFTVGGIWPQATMLVAIASLPAHQKRAVIVAGAVLAGAVIRSIADPPPFMPSLALLVIGQAATLLLLHRATSPAFNRIARGAPASDLLIADPDAFLKPTHALFPCILLFCIGSSYGSIFYEGADSTYFWFCVTVLAIAFLWIAFGTSRLREDMLFSASVLLVLAGFMMVPFSAQLSYPLPGALLASGGICFNILFWLVLAAIGARNVYALIPTFALASCMNYLGVEIGATAGHISAAAIGDQTAGAIALVAGFVFVSFLWLFFRRFSFSDTIQGVEIMKPIVVKTSESVQEIACKQLAEQRGLTDRELEIFTMMAKGRNTKFIQEQLVISPNTVRSHIKHIYQKLDVHSQQELIDLVEAQ